MYARPIIGAIGAAASLVTVIAFLGFDPNASQRATPTPSESGQAPTVQPGQAGGGTPDAAAADAVPRVVITSASLTSDADTVSYEVAGTAFGVKDPPWKVFVVARPKSADAVVDTRSEGEWWVSTEVVPGADGTWRALLLGDRLPPGTTGVVFQPLLVTSPDAVPTPTPIQPTLPPGHSPTPPAVDTVASVEELLSLDGPLAEVVEQTFEAFEIRTPP